MNRTLLSRLYGLWMREGVIGFSRHAFGVLSLRQRFVTKYASFAGPGLEIGPSHSPLASKSKGYNVEILDHADQATLRQKYVATEVDVNNIEHVDHVWRGEPLSTTIGRKACYEWIIASHLVEHTPDFVGFLIECESLLTKSGNLILVVPDKRYCFDHYQSLTSTGDVLDAHNMGLTKPSPGRVFDHHANAVSKGHADGKRGRGAIAWHRLAIGRLRLIHTVEGAAASYRNAQKGDTYIDVHNWHFTPGSFRILIGDLRALGLIELGIVDGPTGAGAEFCVCLRRGDHDGTDRLTNLAKS